MSTIFDSTSLHSAINQSLSGADLGGAKNAFVVVATTSGVKGVLATRLDEHWTVSALFGVDHDAHLEGGLEIKATW